MKNLFLVMLILIFCSLGYCSTITVTGTATLSGKSNHDSIQVALTRTSPSELIYTTYTDSSGNYSFQPEEGIYSISFSKEGYTGVVENDLSIYSKTSLDDVVLKKNETYGRLSGTLKGYHFFYYDVEIPKGKKLYIEAGTRLYFLNSSKLLVLGEIIALGSSSEKIVFTSGDTNLWNGIVFDGSNNDNKLTHCIIEKSDSAGLHIINSTVKINNCSIYNNKNLYTAGGFGGGGIYAENADISIENTEITNNYCDFGGGIFCITSNLEISNSKVSDNSCKGSSGGILLYEDVIATIRYTIVDGNYSAGDDSLATGIYSSKSTLVLENSIVSNNMGTGVDIDEDSYATIVNSVVYGNHQFGIDNACDNFQLYNTIIAGNSSTGLRVLNNILAIQSNCIYNNRGNIYSPLVGWLGEIVTANSNGTPTDVNGNIYQDPEFIGESENKFMLSTGSPCIDAGFNDSVKFNLDIEGYQRIFDGDGNGSGIVDMGAYEFDAPQLIYPLSIKLISIRNESILGEGDGAISIEAEGGVGEYSYLWSTSDSTKNLTGLFAGEYIVALSDVLNNIVYDTFMVYADSSCDEMICIGIDSLVSESFPGAANGAIYLSVNGGAPPYKCSWNTGDITQNITGLSAGDYTLTIIDTTLLKVSRTFTVALKSTTKPKINIIVDSIVNESFTGEADGAIYLTIDGGFPPYKFFWNTGDTTQNITGLTEGEYSIVVFDTKLLSATDTFLIDCLVHAADTLSITGNVSGEGSGMPFTAVLAFKDTNSYYLPLEYDITNSNGDYHITGLPLGEYKLYAVPNPSQNETYFPTYYVNQESWESADIVNLSGNAYNVNIELIPWVHTTTGSAVISGLVIYEDSSSFEEDFYNTFWFEYGITVSDEQHKNYAANIPVLLYSNNNLVSWTLSDISGNYGFDGIPAGTYKVMAQKSGFANSNVTEFVVEDNVQVNIILRSNDIITRLLDANVKPDFDIYPNPLSTGEQLKVRFNNIELKELQYIIINSLGAKVDAQKIELEDYSAEFTIPTEKLSLGGYTILLQNEDYSQSVSFIKQ